MTFKADAYTNAAASNSVAASRHVSHIKRVVAGALTGLLALACMPLLGGCSQQGEGVPQLKDPEISPPTIGVDGKLRVGVNSDNSPLAGKSGDRVIGIDVDIAAALSDQLGLSVEIVDVGADGAEAITEGDVDVVLGIESGADEEGCWLSNQYLQTGIVLFQDADSNAGVPEVDSAPQIAAQVSSKSAWAVTNIFGDESLAAATDLAAAFNNLGSGEVEYVASDAVIGLYAANRQGVDVNICALLESPTGYCAMVSEANTDLQTAISDALTTIKDNGIIDVIEDKWLGQDVDLSGVSKIEGSATPAADANKPEETEGEQGTDSSAATSSSQASSAATSSSSSATSSSKATTTD